MAQSPTLTGGLVRSWPVATRYRYAWRALVWIILHLLIFALLFMALHVVGGWLERAMLLLLLPLLVLSLAAVIREESAPRLLELCSTELSIDLPGPRREFINYNSILECREFSSVIEVVHNSSEVPVRWRLPRHRMRQDHWEEFTSEFKRRVRDSNPTVLIYDEETGPPPAS
jgi:hypothetical protein